MTRRRLAVVAALLLLAVVAVPLRAMRAGHGHAHASGARVGAPGARGIVGESGGAHRPSTPASAEEQALARAYAALGAAGDGDGQRLAALDPEARSQLDEARRLLDEAPARPRAPHVDPTGIGAVSPPASLPATASEQGVATGGAAASDPSLAPEAAASTQRTAMTLDLAHAIDPRSALRDTAEGPELLAPGLWAKVPFRPDRLPRLVIADRTDAGYAIAVYGDDFSTIRLDGGLVVPGRFYHVHGQAVITGATPASVDIRPLGTVPQVAEQPARPPVSNG